VRVSTTSMLLKKSGSTGLFMFNIKSGEELRNSRMLIYPAYYSKMSLYILYMKVAGFGKSNFAV
ncbi:MAG: hypothetical protein M3Z51_02075, partial [Snodgrassella alvi]|nr:hypothetical protein [Snodgrassella alvi]